MSFPLAPAAGVRKVTWAHLPLGAVVLEPPTLFGASIPELLAYPPLTRSLRDQLWSKYQLPSTTRVTILDPDAGVDAQRIGKEDREVRRLMAVAPELDSLKSRFSASWRGQSGVREGLTRQLAAEQGPYSLHKRWTRSIRELVQDTSGFGDQAWGTPLLNQSWGELLGAVLTEQIRLTPRAPSIVDIGLDASASMDNYDKFRRALEALGALFAPLAQRLGTSEWRVWRVGEHAELTDLTRALRPQQAAGEDQTRFAPFFRRVLERDRPDEHHLCLLLTDGVCHDQEAALRWAEQFAKAKVDYLQVVFYEAEEDRHDVVSPYTERALDGVLRTVELKPGEVRVERTDSELEEFSSRKLKDVTSLAEAARGGQTLLRWYPLTGSVLLDVYEQYFLKELLN